MRPLRVATAAILPLALAPLVAPCARAADDAPVANAESPVAAADDDAGDAPVAAPPEAPRRSRIDAFDRPSPRWYGWQTLALDGALLASTVVYLESHDGRTDPAVLLTGLGVYALGAPTIHVAHGQWGHGLASLAARVVAPLTTWGLVRLFGCDHDPEGSSCGELDILSTGLGITAGIVVMLADAGALGWEPRDKPRAPSIAIAPWIDRQARGATVAMTF